MVFPLKYLGCRKIYEIGGNIFEFFEEGIFSDESEPWPAAMRYGLQGNRTRAFLRFIKGQVSSRFYYSRNDEIIKKIMIL